MAFLSHLSQQSYDFIKQPSLGQDDISVQRQINKYVNDLDQVIQTVCEELNSDANTRNNSWERSDKRINPVDRRVPAVEYSIKEKCSVKNHSIDVIIDYEGENWIEFNNDRSSVNPKDLEAFQNSSAYRRYYETIEESSDLKIKAKFSAKQIYSKYFCDYLIHLIEHLYPMMDSCHKEAISEAA